ncbi:MAG: M20/M25/M40 family metallo-hydrolase [Actinobacteria bacterium]|nr:MAG: M20/M25/M40 family metallo-hydrolase [Actinomycetota bacterium]
MTVGPLQSRIGELERRYLSGTFAELCRIESPSGSERQCAERVIAELRAIGVSAQEDDAGSRLGTECGNLLAHIPAAAEAAADERDRDGGRCVLLCAHLDTVPLQAPVEPALIDGYWENANPGILGADNKAAVAVLLALARHLRREGAGLDVELLFTVGEEAALAGARAFDCSRLRSEVGYVFDHASPIGEVIVASPSHFRVDATFNGVAAHAGIRPEQGRSAILAAAHAIASMRLGRLDEETTANVGSISGGSAMNVVAERCSLVAEVRSLKDERAEQEVAALVARLHEAANLPECECDVDVSVQRTFAGYRLAASRPAVRAAERALLACGHEPVRIASGGASDANVLIAGGLETVNLANGTERNHEPGERVSVRALEDMLEVALALIDELGAEVAAPAR